MMPSPNNLKKVFVPSTDLFNGWSFIKVMVVGLHKILGPDGTPAKNPDGTQVYAVESHNYVRNFTFEEYQTTIKSQEIPKV